MIEILLKTISAISIDIESLPKAGTDNSVIINVLNIIIGILAVISFGTVVYGGFKYVISQGEPDKIGKAKDIIMYSLIGLVIAISAFGIVSVFVNFIK